MGVFIKSNFINVVDLTKGYKPPKTVAQRSKDKMMTGDGMSPLPSKPDQASASGVKCGQCGHHHQVGNICSFDKSSLDGLFDYITKGNPNRQPKGAPNSSGGQFAKKDQGIKDSTPMKHSGAHGTGDGDGKKTEADVGVVSTSEGVMKKEDFDVSETESASSPEMEKPSGDLSRPEKEDVGDIDSLFDLSGDSTGSPEMEKPGKIRPKTVPDTTEKIGNADTQEIVAPPGLKEKMQAKQDLGAADTQEIVAPPGWGEQDKGAAPSVESISDIFPGKSPEETKALLKDAGVPDSFAESIVGGSTEQQDAFRKEVFRAAESSRAREEAGSTGGSSFISEQQRRAQRGSTGDEASTEDLANRRQFARQRLLINQASDKRGLVEPKRPESPLARLSAAERGESPPQGIDAVMPQPQGGGAQLAPPPQQTGQQTGAQTGQQTGQQTTTYQPVATTPDTQPDPSQTKQMGVPTQMSASPEGMGQSSDDLSNFVSPDADTGTDYKQMQKQEKYGRVYDRAIKQGMPAAEAHAIAREGSGLNDQVMAPDWKSPAEQREASKQGKLQEKEVASQQKVKQREAAIQANAQQKEAAGMERTAAKEQAAKEFHESPAGQMMAKEKYGKTYDRATKQGLSPEQAHAAAAQQSGLGEGSMGEDWKSPAEQKGIDKESKEEQSAADKEAKDEQRAIDTEAGRQQRSDMQTDRAAQAASARNDSASSGIPFSQMYGAGAAMGSSLGTEGGVVGPTAGFAAQRAHQLLNPGLRQSTSPTLPHMGSQGERSFKQHATGSTGKMSGAVKSIESLFSL